MTENLNSVMGVINMQTMPAASSRNNNLFLFLLYLAIFAIVFIVLFLDINQTFPLVKWVRDSSQPKVGVLMLSLAITNVLWLFLSLGLFSEVAVGPFKFASRGRQASRNQIILCSLLALFSLGYLLITPPACETPVITFEVNTGSETKQYTPENTVSVSGVRSVVIGIKPDTFTNSLDCQMEVMGPILDRYSQNHTSCSTTVYLQNQPGSVVVSAFVKKKYCESYTSYNLTILNKETP